MRRLYHFKLCPFSRKLRVVLAEKGLDFTMVDENFWEKRSEFAGLNPAMEVPVLVEPDDRTIPDSYAICEYLEEQYIDSPNMLGDNTMERAGVRRLVSWFDIKFYNEVSRYLLNEKVFKFLLSSGEPDSKVIRFAKKNMINHLKYMTFLVKDCKYLLGDKISLADIAAASQLSVLDFLGEVPWESFLKVKEWYALVKSRPSFRSVLSDSMPGFRPPAYYANPDF